MENNGEKTYKRRKRYSGTHPKKYSEKYKEHNPDKYADTIEKVISKGSTPAGMHLSIMVDEILEFLDIQPGQIGIDATLGYGGHSKAMLEKLEGQGHLYGFDVDPIEMPKTVERLKNTGYGEEVFTAVHTNFRDIDQVIEKYGQVDFLLADLGVSSMQIDNPERGFSYKVDGPLDLRLNPEKGVSAAKRLEELNRDDIINLLVENSDEPYAEEIAQAIMIEKWKGEPIQTTTALRQAVESALRDLPKKERAERVKKSCARTFQALRIDVNSEFEVLFEFLEKLPNALKPGGRVAVLTFHSGEDRLVKKSFKEFKNLGLYEDVARNVIRPSATECHRNPRAKSTKMRWAIKSSTM